MDARIKSGQGVLGVFGAPRKEDVDARIKSGQGVAGVLGAPPEGRRGYAEQVRARGGRDCCPRLFLRRFGRKEDVDARNKSAQGVLGIVVRAFVWVGRAGLTDVAARIGSGQGVVGWCSPRGVMRQTGSRRSPEGMSRATQLFHRHPGEGGGSGVRLQHTIRIEDILRGVKPWAVRADTAIRRAGYLVRLRDSGAAKSPSPCPLPRGRGRRGALSPKGEGERGAASPLTREREGEGL